MTTSTSIKLDTASTALARAVDGSGVVAVAPTGAARLLLRSCRAGDARAARHVGAAAVLLGVKLPQLLEAADARGLCDAGVRSAQEHDALTALDRFEHSTRLEIAFRPEIFADFAALLHGCQRAPTGAGWAKFRV